MSTKKENLKVILCMGAPSSGKSTWAKEHIKKNPNYVRIGRDEFRYMLKDQGFCEPKIEDLITELQNKAIISALAKNLNVIVDNTNLKVKYVNEIIKLVESYADVEYLPFDVSKEKCIERDKLRDRKVGEEVINRMYKDWLIFKDTFHFQPVKKLKTRKTIVPDFESDLQDAVIIDIDGTLTTGPHQLRSPYDWDKVHLDEPNHLIIELASFYETKGRRVIIVSGRDEVCRKKTEDWLRTYGVKYDELHMRPKDSFEKDTVIKRRIYNEHIKDKYNVLCVIDDRLSVLEMWNDLGLFTLNVNQYQQIF